MNNHIPQKSMEEFCLEATPDDVHAEIERELDCLMIVDMARHQGDKNRFEQHMFIKSKWQDLTPCDKLKLYEELLTKLMEEKKTKLMEEKKKEMAAKNKDESNKKVKIQLNPGMLEAGEKAPTVQDFILKRHYENKHHCHLSTNECSRVRHHAKVIELENAMIDASNHENCTWQQHLNPLSQCCGHWHITMKKDVHLGPLDEKKKPKPLPIAIAPVITRCSTNAPMGNCESCFKIGRLRTECQDCGEQVHTLNFHGSRTRLTDRTGIVDPRKLEEASIIDHQPALIYPMPCRSGIPLRWTAVEHKTLSDYMDDHVLERMGEGMLCEDKQHQMAEALKYDFKTFNKRYHDHYNKRMFVFMEEDSESESEAESAASIDKNTIG